MPEYPLKEETYRIIGACFEVYNQMGCGFTEPVYQACFEIELGLQDIPAQAQKELALNYKGHRIGKAFVPDFLCFGEVIHEIKAVSALADEHRAQLLNYLNAAELKVGLLVNFGHHPKLEYERIIAGKGGSRLSASSV
ncbi:MAG: GxxExxY protein [Phycisphaerae bacterium]|nr:GxxExxY protein [Phycisphaerae bacterium]